ncbi:MAG: TonB-dependent receptor [Thiotrichaceae bacterium]|nr:TonB-dependent receptor [Thiotrichaceae bacterium]
MNNYSFIIMLAISCLCSNLSAKNLSIKDLQGLDLASLLNITVETASGTEESLIDAPASMVIITTEQIAQRGYHNLVEVLQDVPGFDVMITNGPMYSNSYQRGYRLPFMSRTLLMFNGVVDNLLWSHEGALSRQYPLSNIKHIEILYGPASAVYGPNAFLGVINVITHDGSDLEVGEYVGEINTLVGSFKSKGLDINIQGKPLDDLSFSIAAKLFKSNEEDLSDRWGFTSNEKYANRTTWGGILDFEHEGQQLGHYYDPTNDYGVMANMTYKGLKLGLINWRTKEAYGGYYASDRTQNNLFWNKFNAQYYAEYKTDLTDSLKSKSFISHQTSRHYGYWGEAEPDGNLDSFISLTQWNSINYSWLFKQDFEYRFSDNLLLSSGLKYQRKELTKSYDVPGYWESSVSSSAESGSGIGHSTDPSYTPPPPPYRDMLESNLAHTRDIGGYVQAIIDAEPLRFNLGVRYDKNSIYGQVVNPRISAIYKHNSEWTFKLLYGHAFQEPAPLQLWGGWSGRQANEDLKPERVQNLEGVILHQWENIFHELSIYKSHYSDVIKEEAENAGQRDIYGLEYRLQSSFSNFLDADDIDVYFNYTYTHSTSSVYYNHDESAWLIGDAELGDIAPHKWNAGINLPLSSYWNWNVRVNYVGEREPYLRNPLRGKRVIDNYFTLNTALSYEYAPFTLTLKVLNALDEQYFHPGAEAASAGDDFSQRSLGYQNSLIPQAGRSYWLNLRWQF